MNTGFMEPFPVLHELSGDQWKLWRQSLIAELGPSHQDLQSYLPKWLRQNSKKLGLPEWWTDLADYEWSMIWAVLAENKISPNSKFGLNPFARILRLKYDIASWLSHRDSNGPAVRANILAIGPRGKTEATFEMAAMIEELQDGFASKELLFEALEKQFGREKDWAAAYRILASIGVVN